MKFLIGDKIEHLIAYLIKKLDIVVTCWYNTAFRVCLGMSGTGMFILLNIVPIWDSLDILMFENYGVVSPIVVMGTIKSRNKTSFIYVLGMVIATILGKCFF